MNGETRYTVTRHELAAALTRAKWYGFASGEESLLAAAITEHLPRAGVSIPEAQLLARIAEVRSWALQPGRLDSLLLAQLLPLLDGGAAGSPTSTAQAVGADDAGEGER